MATFGKTIAGATPFSMGNAGLYTCRFRAVENGIITKLTAYLYWAYLPFGLMAVIYSDNAGRPDILLAQGTPVTQTEYGWIDLPITCNIEAGKDYHIGFCGNSQTYGLVDAGQVGQTNQDGIDNYPNPPSTFGTPRQAWDHELTIYATYTPTAPSVLQIVISPTSATIQVGQTQQFSALVSGGIYPYTVEWIDEATGNVIGTGETINLSFSIAGTYLIHANVRDSSTPAQTAISNSASITVTEAPPPPPPTYILNVTSTPISGIPFTIERVS